MPFVDAKELIEKGAAQLSPGQILKIDHFTLMDAMNAIEIMDPRMDSGVDLEAFPIPVNEHSDSPPIPPTPPPFEPMKRLLPDEVCWVLDQAMICEATYLQGPTLSQTFYTLRYFHVLPRITLEALYEAEASERSASGRAVKSQPPPELIGLVLRASVVGIAKCLGFVWEELVRQNLYDGEDFSGDKFGLDLCDEYSVEESLYLLDEAKHWLQASDIEDQWRDALLLRIEMRRTLLIVLSRVCLPTFQSTLHSIILPHLSTLSNDLLPRLQSSLAPSPSSAVPSVFDAYINRQLVSHAPLQPLVIGSWEEGLGRMIEMVNDISTIMSVVGDERVMSSTGWFEYLALRSYSLSGPTPVAFIRSLALSTICSENRIAGHYSLKWLTDNFLYESALVEPGTLLQISETGGDGDSYMVPMGPASWTGERSQVTLSSAIVTFQQRLAGFLVNNYAVMVGNRARQKRNAANAISQWEELFNEAAQLMPMAERKAIAVQMPKAQSTALGRVTLAVYIRRLELIAETVMSGFDLELYDRSEWPMVYWLSARLYGLISLSWQDMINRAQKISTGEESKVVFVRWKYQLRKSMVLRDLSLAALFRLRASYQDSAKRTKTSVLNEKRFNMRFKWSQVKNPTTDSFIPLWRTFKSDWDGMATSPKENLLNRSSELLSEVEQDLKVCSQSINDLKGDTAEQITALQNEFLASLQACCATDPVAGQKRNQWFPPL